MATMVMCSWQVVHLPHSGVFLAQLWCISGASLVQAWCISDTSLVQLWCISGASLVLLSHSDDLMQFFPLPLRSFAAPPSVGWTLSVRSGFLPSITFCSSSSAKTLLRLPAMILVDFSCLGRQAAGEWQVRPCLSHQLSRTHSQSILGFLTRQEPPG